MQSVLISPEPIEAAAELDRFVKSVTGAGGIVSFTGLVRPERDDIRVLRLELDHYAQLTQASIETTVQAAEVKWKLLGANVRHRVGAISPGEVIVFVATAAPNRRAAFEAADFLMDYLKTEAPFWKKEVTTSGESWIEPREQDYADRNRWNSLEGLSICQE